MTAFGMGMYKVAPFMSRRAGLLLGRRAHRFALDFFLATLYWLVHPDDFAL